MSDAASRVNGRAGTDDQRARSQWRPDGPVTVVVGYPFGGGSDLVGRPIMGELQKIWNVPINIENRPGGNGVTAALEIADAVPDGRTILLGHVSSNAIAPAVLGDHSLTERLCSLRPISRMASQAHVLIVNASSWSEALTLADFVNFVRSSKRTLTYGSTGHGSMQHMVAEQFFRLANISLRHVPYLGSTPAMADLRMGRIDCIYEGIVPAAPFIEEGIFRALALSIPRRIADLPIPSLSEQGYPNFDMRGWWGLFAPPETPASIIEGWCAGLREALCDSEIRRFAISLGMELSGEDSRSFSHFLREERARYAEIATLLNVTEFASEFTLA